MQKLSLRLFIAVIFLVILVSTPLSQPILPLPIPTPNNPDGFRGIEPSVLDPDVSRGAGDPTSPQIEYAQTSIYGTVLVSDTTNSAPWTPTEQNEVLYAQIDTGTALQRRSHFPTKTIANIFREVMVNGDYLNYILLVRANKAPPIQVTNPNNTNYQYSYNAPLGGCISFNGTGAVLPPSPQIPAPKVIVCNGSFAVTRHTVVHEFGHLFDYSSSYTQVQPGQPLPPPPYPFRWYVEDTNTWAPLYDCRGTGWYIMGNPSGTTGGWTRGARGWGSGPATQPNNTRLITTFQQNSDNNYVEAAADLFLNWVYRSNTVGGNGKGIVSCDNLNWAAWTGPGFVNKSWQGQTASPGQTCGSVTGTCGTNDGVVTGVYILSGDRRHKWMHQHAKYIFGVHTSW